MLKASWFSMAELRSFVRRYKWVTTLLGALLVFITFYVKDLKREELKDFVDSLSSAETSYLIRSDIQSINDRLSRTFDIKPEKGSLDAANLDSGAWVVNMNGTLSNLDTLLDAEGDDADPAQEPSSSALRKRLKELADQYNARIDSIAALPDAPAGMKDVAPSSIAVELMRGIARTIDDAKNLSDEIRSFKDEVFKKANKLEEDKTKAYHRFTVLSTVLYSTGWLIGLLGQFLGAELTEAE